MFHCWSQKTASLEGAFPAVRFAWTSCQRAWNDDWLVDDGAVQLEWDAVITDGSSSLFRRKGEGKGLGRRATEEVSLTIITGLGHPLLRTVINDQNSLNCLSYLWLKVRTTEGASLLFTEAKPRPLNMYVWEGG